MVLIKTEVFLNAGNRELIAESIKEGKPVVLHFSPEELRGNVNDAVAELTPLLLTPMQIHALKRAKEGGFDLDIKMSPKMCAAQRFSESELPGIVEEQEPAAEKIEKQVEKQVQKGGEYEVLCLPNQGHGINLQKMLANTQRGYGLPQGQMSFR